MSKHLWVVLAAVALLGGTFCRVQAQQPAVPAPQEADDRRDDRPWQYAPTIHIPTSVSAPSGADEAPHPYVPETSIPASEFHINPSEFHFNASEFHPPTTAVTEFAPSVSEAGWLFRGGEELGLLAGGGAAAAGAGALLGRKKGAK
jgi:hypothetical protein